MNLTQAHTILDRHKEGTYAYSLLTISKALYLTGDLGAHEGLRSEGMDRQVQGDCIRAWGEPGKTLVEQNDL